MAYLFSIILILVTRLPFINSGLNVLEPDEWLYQNIAQTLTQGPWPFWQGIIFLQRHFSFLYLAYWLGMIFPPYINSRLISLVFDILFTVCLVKIYKILKLPSFVSCISIILVTTLPLHWFFSRQGTYEMFAVGFAQIFLLVLLSKPKSVLLGITLALALVSKFSNVLLLPMFLFVRPKIKITIAFALSFLILTGPMIIQTPFDFINQFFFGFYGLSPTFHLRSFFSIWYEYFKLAPMWLSFPVIFLTGIGILKNRNWVLTLGLVVCLGYLGLYYVNDRIFMVLLPLISVLVAIGVNEIRQHRLLLVVLALITTYQGFFAFKSTLHTSRETALSKLERMHQIYPNYQVYTVFDPPKTIASLPELKIRLLDHSATSSAIVLADDLQSANMLNLSEPEYVEAKNIYSQIRAKYSPNIVITDPLPHFPWTYLPNNFYLYVF